MSVKRGLSEEIEGDLGMFEEDVPEVFWGGVVDTC